MSSENPYDLARRAADAMLSACGVDHFDIAVVLGSGWKEASESLGAPLGEVATTALPGFHAPTVPGHEGRIFALNVGGKSVAMVAGRVHLYEGNSAHDVAHPVRSAIFTGASTVVLTNAAGGIDPDHGPGTVVALSDHINLTGTSPLEGDNPPADLGSRFVDLSSLYDPEARAVIQRVAPGTPEGVYAGFRGPHYETPAEIRMARTMGASLVGMSTVLEAIAARHLGSRVVGLSLVTNLAAGVSAAPLNHLEVLDAGRSASAGLSSLMAALLPEL